MYKKRIIDVMSELEDIKANLLNASVDPNILIGTSLDFDEAHIVANIIDEALNNLESATAITAGN